jgi:polygalacturonase
MFASSSIQSAIDSLSGVRGTVKVPRGTWVITGLVIPSSVTLEGDGRLTTFLSMSGASTSAHGIEIQGDNVYIR